MFAHDLYLPQRGRWILRSKRRMRSPTQRVGVVGGDAKGWVTTFLYGDYLTFFDTFGVTDLRANRAPHPPQAVPLLSQEKALVCANMVRKH